MAKRELIDTGTDKRYIRRDEKGQFKESTNVGQPAGPQAALGGATAHEASTS
jgi:hypothetical protein